VEGVLIPTSHKLKKITEMVQSIFLPFTPTAGTGTSHLAFVRAKSRPEVLQNK
jgi:hypothetical protein